MATFDVKSLFTSSHIGKTLDVIHKKLTADDILVEKTALVPSQVIQLFEICYRITHFLYQGHTHEQKDRTAIGSPILRAVLSRHMCICMSSRAHV